MNIDKTFGEKIPNVQYYDREGAYLIVIQKGKAATVRTERAFPDRRRDQRRRNPYTVYRTGKFGRNRVSYRCAAVYLFC